MVQQEKANAIYAAATVDCEGYVGIAASMKEGGVNPSFWVRVAVTNTDQKLVDWLYKTFGGYISVYDDKNPKHKLRYVWYTQHQSAIDFLRIIYPYLKLKAKQVDVVIEFQETFNCYFPKKLGVPKEILDKRWLLKNQIHFLNKKGAICDSG